jgi:hypothetical protein
VVAAELGPRRGSERTSLFLLLKPEGASSAAVLGLELPLLFGLVSFLGVQRVIVLHRENFACRRPPPEINQNGR